jgi:hypothetical protein
MRWWLYIEEYSPELQYIKGTHNVVADALSRLDKLETPMEDTQELFWDCWNVSAQKRPMNYISTHSISNIC